MENQDFFTACLDYGHCWHTSPETHKAMDHKDEVCCRCGKYQCIGIMKPEHRHGKFQPESYPTGEVRG